MKTKTACLFIAVVLSTACSLFCKSEERVYFNHPFNPVQGLVNEVEKPYRKEICLNGMWDFMPVYNASSEDFVLPSSFRKEDVSINIPSPWNVNNFTNGQGGDFKTFPSYPDKWNEAKIGWMRKNVAIPADWNGSRHILHFEAVMGKAQVYVNGRKAAENFELFLPFEVDVTSYLKPGEENEIMVGVAKADLFDERGRYGRRTYVGGSMWGIEMAGIWQDVYLFAFPPVYVQDVFVQPEVKNSLLKIELTLHNTTDRKQVIDVGAAVRKWYNLAGRTVSEAPEQKGEMEQQAALLFPDKKKVTLPANAVTKITIEKTVSGELSCWTPETPYLYGAIIHLREKEKNLDVKYVRFGWREFDIQGDKLLLNGKQVFLRGDSWHFMGVPQMTRRYVWAWFNMLKDANANAVRFHAQPFPRFYLDVADEMGICVLDETGIWSSDGGPKIDGETYWESCMEHIRRLFHRDKNHPSVFGWSVCNETLPVAVHVFKAPEELVQRQLDGINRWVQLVKDLDPTRPWISGDGEDMRPTSLPTVIGHYGDKQSMKNWASRGKPWGIGEQSMAYYGTPKQASQYNGDRAYESMLGRMEAIAVESYDLIKTQRELNASYSSVFNIVWYGLQPLALGLKDVARAPAPDDGIFFEFVEGAPGMHPERLGPYTTTLNPGYDPSLPMYKAWPMFDAIRNANATPIRSYSIDNGKDAPQILPVVPADGIVVLTASETFREKLEDLGLKLLDPKNLTASSLLVIDGIHPPGGNAAQEVIKKATDGGNGVRIFIMGITPETQAFVNQILPFPVSTEKREATSFLKQGNSLLLQGFGHADFYFSELIPRGKTAMHYGLSGDFVRKSEILLRANNTDWQRWNNQPETSKTGNVYRSELEAKNPDAVIVACKSGKSEIILSTLDLSEVPTNSGALLSTMFTNLGARISNENVKEMKALDAHAHLNRALLLGPFGRNETSVANLLSADIPDGGATVNPQLNAISGGQAWKIISADEKGVLHLPKPARDRRQQVAYLSFRMYSPRSLSNLLAEPDMPSMDMFIKTAGGFTLYLNNVQVSSVENVNNAEWKVPNIMPDKGWNHVLIKLADIRPEAQISVDIRFESTDKNFMKQILSSVVGE
jgi:beta-galactosidase